MKRQNSILFTCCIALVACHGVQAADSTAATDTVVVPEQEYSNSHSDRADSSEIILNVHEDGTVTIDGERFTDKVKLYAKLYERALQGKDQTIRIRGEAKTEYQKMVDVLDSCTKAGFKNVLFSTKRVVPAPEPVTLELRNDGSVLVDGERSASREELVGKLKSLHEENSHAAFRILGASNVRHAHVMTLLEDLTKAGIKSIQLSTVDEPS